MPPFFLQKSTKILPIIDSKMHRFFDRFLHRFFFDFASIWEANLEPCWPLSRSKYGGPNQHLGGLCWAYLLFRFYNNMIRLMTSHVRHVAMNSRHELCGLASSNHQYSGGQHNGSTRIAIVALHFPPTCKAEKSWCTDAKCP